MKPHDHPLRICKNKIQVERERLLTHPIYHTIDTKEKLRTLMESHVFAVWDFMTLLKRLQRDLTCVTIPWTYVDDAETARIINDIVIAEETDVGLDGTVKSHMELYIDAMNEVGADTKPFLQFHDLVKKGHNYKDAFKSIGAPKYIVDFVNTTMDVAINGTTSEVLGMFLFSREDLIPEMFQTLLDNWKIDKKNVPAFSYYLDRHIELDNDEHGPAAEKALERLIEKAPEQIDGVIDVTKKGLDARYNLWSGVCDNIK